MSPKSPASELVIFQNFFTPYRHRLFNEIARKTDLTVVYLQKPEEEGRKWDEATFGNVKHYKTVQLENKRIAKFSPFKHVVLATGLTKLKDVVSRNTKVIFLDNMPTNFTMLQILNFLSFVPRKNRALWVEHILPKGADGFTKNLFKRIMTWILAFQVDTIFSFSSMTSAYLKALGIPLRGQKVTRVFQSPYSEEQIETFRAESDAVPKKTLNIGYLGYFSKRKGIYEILKAIQLYRNPKMNFYFIGDGPAKNDIARAALKDSRIHLEAYAQTEGDKTTFFNKISYHLVPSEKDPWVLVVNEAAARGVPSIVSANVGAKELINEIDPSLVLEDASAVALTKTFVALQERFSHKARLHAERERTYTIAKKWTIERFATPFTALVKSS